MKKTLLAIATLCYFVVSCGVVVNAHFCMNELASVELFETASETCGRCGMDTHASNGCCRDEMSFVKMQDDQQYHPYSTFELAALDPVISIPSVYMDAPTYNVTEQRHFHNHSPPLLSALDIYIENRVFRI